MIFHGLNSMLFLYLFFKSNYLPAILPGFGVFAYALIFVYAVLTILSPGYAAMPTIQIVCMAPSVLTEILMGFWLLTRSVNVVRTGAAE